jgi:D-alanyl-lipoteichoic acid acyltransferase DltB (MBOAT superfamily)
MLLGGLWHGASWNFVIWGAIHGVGLAGTRMYQRSDFSRDPSSANDAPSPWGRFLSVAATFHFVCFAWIFFRAPTFGKAMDVLAAVGAGTTHLPNVTPIIALLIFGTLLIHLLPKRLEEQAAKQFVRMPALAQGGIFLGVAVLLQQVKSAAVVPFIYFQF